MCAAVRPIGRFDVRRRARSLRLGSGAPTLRAARPMFSAARSAGIVFRDSRSVWNRRLGIHLRLAPESAPGHEETNP